MVFKFQFSNKFTFGGRGTIGGKNLASTWNSIKSFFSGKAAEADSEPKTFAEGASDTALICEGTVSLDISVEEMTTLLKYKVESDQCAWDLMKTMGKDLLKGEKAAREAAKEAIPEWQEICHRANLKSSAYFHEEWEARQQDIFKSKKNAEKAEKTSEKRNPFSEL